MSMTCVATAVVFCYERHSCAIAGSTQAPPPAQPRVPATCKPSLQRRSQDRHTDDMRSSCGDGSAVLAQRRRKPWHNIELEHRVFCLVRRCLLLNLQPQ